MGGRGMLLGGVPSVAAGRVMVIGGGVVGQNAAEIAIGMGAETYVYDRSIDRLRELEVLLNGRCSTVSLPNSKSAWTVPQPPRRRPEHRHCTVSTAANTPTRFAICWHWKST